MENIKGSQVTTMEHTKDSHEVAEHMESVNPYMIKTIQM